jgi:flagellar hook-basal body protein
MNVSGMYTGAMGMIHQIQKIDTRSNNIANSQTIGYKEDAETFRVYDESFKKIQTNNNLYNGLEGDTAILGPYHDQVYTDHIQTNFLEGSPLVTGKPFDFMLHDDTDKVSFFTVQKDDQTYLTRGGNFKVNEKRELCTVNGAFVLDDKGQHIVVPDGKSMTSDSQGNLILGDAKEPFSKLQLHSIDKEHINMLEKKQGGFYQPMTADEIVTMFGSSIDGLINKIDSDPTLKSYFGTKANLEAIKNSGKVDLLQGFLGSVKSGVVEQSNVDMSKALVDLIVAQRDMQASQRTVTVFDSIANKDSNDVGR